MLATAVVAALSFSAPPSLTRRDMMVGFGAAAAVTFKAPAFAADKQLSKAEQKAATEEAHASASADRGLFERLQQVLPKLKLPELKHPHAW